MNDPIAILETQSFQFEVVGAEQQLGDEREHVRGGDDPRRPGEPLQLLTLDRIGGTPQAPDDRDRSPDDDQRREDRHDVDPAAERIECMQPQGVLDLGVPDVAERARAEQDGERQHHEADGAGPGEPAPPRRGQVPVGEQQQEEARDADERHPGRLRECEPDPRPGEPLREGVLGVVLERERHHEPHPEHQPRERGARPLVQHDDARDRERQEDRGEAPSRYGSRWPGRGRCSRRR